MEFWLLIPLVYSLFTRRRIDHPGWICINFIVHRASSRVEEEEELELGEEKEETKSSGLRVIFLSRREYPRGQSWGPPSLSWENVGLIICQTKSSLLNEFFFLMLMINTFLLYVLISKLPIWYYTLQKWYKLNSKFSHVHIGHILM